jgi:hypothetical protein
MTERLWIGPRITRLLSLEPLKPVRFTTDFQNSGKSPALGVHVVVMNVSGVPPTDDVHSMRVSQNTACDGWPNISRDGPMVLPGATYGVNFSSDPLPTQASTEAVLKGSVGMYLLGCVRYWDAFGKIHDTKFCQFFSPSDGQFNYCQGSNDAD